MTTLSNVLPKLCTASGVADGCPRALARSARPIPNDEPSASIKPAMVFMDFSVIFVEASKFLTHASLTPSSSRAISNRT